MSIVATVKVHDGIALGADSKLQRVSTELAAYDANLVALPEERIEEFRRMVE